MTNNNQVITLPDELVQKWANEYWFPSSTCVSNFERYIATQAARWGADQELEACCEWFSECSYGLEDHVSDKLRAARRSEPPSLKEQALQVLANADGADHPVVTAARRSEPPSLKEQAMFAAAVLQSPDETCSIAEIIKHWRTIRRAIESLPD